MSSRGNSLCQDPQQRMARHPKETGRRMQPLKYACWARRAYGRRFHGACQCEGPHSQGEELGFQSACAWTSLRALGGWMLWSVCYGRVQCRGLAWQNGHRRAQRWSGGATRVALPRGERRAAWFLDIFGNRMSRVGNEEKRRIKVGLV